MWSRAASALVPITVTTLPLTSTRPCSIIASAPRRLATPAAARIFWRRSSLAGGRGFHPTDEDPSAGAPGWGVNSGAAANSTSDSVPATFAALASPSVSSPIGSSIIGSSASGAAANSGSVDSGLRATFFFGFADVDFFGLAGAVFLLLAVFFVLTVFFVLGLGMGRRLGFCLLCKGRRSRSCLCGGGG